MEDPARKEGKTRMIFSIRSQGRETRLQLGGRRMQGGSEHRNYPIKQKVAKAKGMQPWTTSNAQALQNSWQEHRVLEKHNS